MSYKELIDRLNAQSGKMIQPSLVTLSSKNKMLGVLKKVNLDMRFGCTAVFMDAATGNDVTFDVADIVSVVP